jgi:hypothetical protein
MKLAGATVIVAAALAAAAALFGSSGGQVACEATEGKWASATRTCITRECFKTKSCGEWANPSSRCNRVKAGDSRAEVYFQLGMPHEDSATSASWNAEKGTSAQIVAQLAGETLAALSCPATAQ